MKDILSSCRADENNPKWKNMIKREKELYSRKNDIRTDFERDYARVIHSQAYRRMKHKTQVFFAPENDHICTRSEHVVLVESIAYTIAKYLGLNVELTRAIATAHDIGHSPFGHTGERILSEITQRDLNKRFWHERNGVEIVDKIELLDTPDGGLQNLDLTYAVRDGIISHCGEIDENMIKPREEYINLDEYQQVNQFAPYTWEGCVVKIADKISYLGRDIVDGVSLEILDEPHLKELYDILGFEQEKKVNNTTIINDFIIDLCENSNSDKGLSFSSEMFEKMNNLKKFNYNNIYFSEKITTNNDYFKLMLNNIYEILKMSFKNRDRAMKICSDLVLDFELWVRDFWNRNRTHKNYNDVIFDITNEKDYLQAIIYYISGMTDNYAVLTFNKILKY